MVNTLTLSDHFSNVYLIGKISICSFFMNSSLCCRSTQVIQSQLSKVPSASGVCSWAVCCTVLRHFNFISTLCGPKDCSLPVSSVHGILQARILSWIAMPSSRGSSHPRDPTCISCLLHWWAGSLPLMPPGKPIHGLLLLLLSRFSRVQLYATP